ncbi:TPA: hypothetical protein NII34_002893 [Pseudomonas aeruginosa]|nr:hypothetical protein [Pseudomonas aeruginosa]
MHALPLRMRSLRRNGISLGLQQNRLPRIWLLAWILCGNATGVRNMGEASAQQQCGGMEMEIWEMMVLKSEKYLTLFSYKGMPVYVGDQCITRRTMVWWWPINWIAVFIGAPIIIWRLWCLSRGRKSNG